MSLVSRRNTPSAISVGRPDQAGELLVQTADSNTGTSTSVIVEAGTTDLAIGEEVGLDDNSQDTLIFSGLVPGNMTEAEVGYLSAPLSGTFGFYAGVDGYGIGVYFSLGGGGAAAPDLPEDAVDNED